MKKALLVVMSVIFSGVLFGCQSSSQPILETSAVQTITGSIAYRERIALLPGALVTIMLEDVSRADAPAEVIAKHRFETNSKQIPLEFQLDYDSRKIQENHTYNVRARIEVNGKLRFITDTITPVITDSNQTQHVDLMLKGVRQ